MNSRTSRPRSPTRAITLTSASVERAIIPSSDDLPTPDPAKMPRRWPRPQGTSASSERTPRPTRSRIGGRVSAGGGEAIMPRACPSSGGPPSSGLPRPSTMRPSSSSDTVIDSGWPVARTRLPGPTPASSPSGISSVRPSRNPTTSAGTGGRVPARVDRAELTDLGVEAGRLGDQPDQVRDEAGGPGEVGVLKRGGEALERRHPPSSASSASRARSSFPRAVASISQRVGADGGAAAGHAPLGLHLDVGNAAELDRERLRRLAHQREVVGVDEDEHAVALDQAAQRAAHDVDHAFGLRRERPGDDALGQGQRKLDGLRLDVVGGLLAGRPQLGAGRLEDREDGGELGERLDAAGLDALLAALLPGERDRLLGLGADGGDQLLGVGRGRCAGRVLARLGRRLQLLEAHRRKGGARRHRPRCSRATRRSRPLPRGGA